MTDYRHAQEEISATLLELGGLANELGEEILAKTAVVEIERLRDGRLILLVCGEIKMGKSSLINALLGISDLVPTDFDIATSTAILISAGESLRSYIVLEEGGEPQPIGNDEVMRYASESQRDRLEVPPRAVLIEAPSPFLTDGIVVVDTPGLGSLKQSHSEVTFGIMAEANLILFVSDAQSPLTTHELEFITRRIVPLNEEFAIVQTKIDQQGAYEEIIAENRDKLVKLLGRAPPIVATSSQSKWDYLKRGDAADLADSGFPALETLIADTLRENGQLRITARAARIAVDIAAKLIAPRQIELAAIEGPGSPAYILAKRQVDEAVAEAEHLRTQRGQWRNRLNQEIGDLRERVINRALARRLIEIEAEFRLLTTRTTLAGVDLNSIALDVEEQLKHAVVVALREIDAGVDRVRTALAAEVGLSLSSVARDAEPVVRSAPDLLTEQTTGWAMKLGDWATQARRQVTGGFTLGSIIGGIVGAGFGVFAGGVGALPGFLAGAQIGGAIGIVGGGATSIPTANKFVREKKMRLVRETLEQQIAPYIRIGSREAQDQCLDVLAQSKDALAEEFDLRINDRLLDISLQQSALARGLEMEQTDMASRKLALVAELDRLNALSRRATEAQAVFNAL